MLSNKVVAKKKISKTPIKMLIIEDYDTINFIISQCKYLNYSIHLNYYYYLFSYSIYLKAKSKKMPLVAGTTQYENIIFIQLGISALSHTEEI